MPSNVDKSCQNKPFIAFTRTWYTGRIRKELSFVKSTIKGVFTTLTPYPFPSLFFPLTSFSECSLHGPHKINATFRGNAQILLQIAVLFAAQKLARFRGFRGSQVKKRRIRASFWPFKNLSKGSEC